MSSSVLPLSGGERSSIDPKELTGTHGINRIMNFVDSKSPAAKGSYEYKPSVPHIFKPANIGSYSAKIKSICDNIYNAKTDTVSEGIILIYSAYIDGGLIPMALALEEMGFTRFGERASLFKTAPVAPSNVKTMKSTKTKHFAPAKYAMITGDARLSPSNDLELNHITSDDNIDGSKIKVVLISQAGSEGMDYKAIRQVHVMDPWYNINRIEQIVGRAVRIFSHKLLAFQKRNVEIFLHGSLLKTAEEEAADLYTYRLAEQKAVKIGRVSRILKQTAVDCVINHAQTQLVAAKFAALDGNANIIQMLSDGQKLENFAVGDVDNSVACDFMGCEFKCIPHEDVDADTATFHSYHENFMLTNADKIVRKIKDLMKSHHFYKKHNFIALINTPKHYPISQIYSALTYIIDDATEYITDKYGRIGYLVNIGEYYLFQPIELGNPNISLYDRSVPIDYKHKSVRFQIKEDIARPISIQKDSIVRGDEDVVVQEDNAMAEISRLGGDILASMFANYTTAASTVQSITKSERDWYKICGNVMINMSAETNIFPSISDQERLAIFRDFLVHHIVDVLSMHEKINLLNYLNANPILEEHTPDLSMRYLIQTTRSYLLSQAIVAENVTAIILFDGPSRITNLKVFSQTPNGWRAAEPEDVRDIWGKIGGLILDKRKLGLQKNKFIGFIGFESGGALSYKIKNIENKRSTGFRCNQAGKDKIIKMFGKIIDGGEELTEGASANELCVRQEMMLRGMQRAKINGDTWFVSTTIAIINEFEKHEKVAR